MYIMCALMPILVWSRIVTLSSSNYVPEAFASHAGSVAGSRRGLSTRAERNRRVCNVCMYVCVCVCVFVWVS